jgi:hypothetical protein
MVGKYHAWFPPWLPARFHIEIHYRRSKVTDCSAYSTERGVRNREGVISAVLMILVFRRKREIMEQQQSLKG